MQRLQDSVFSIFKTTNLSPAVFNYLQPSEDFPDKTPLGGILNDTKHGWLALGPKFCVVDLRTGLKVAQKTFGAALSNFRTHITSVAELPTPLTDNSQQLLIGLECEDIAGMICVFHINGSQILRCIQTEVAVTELAVCDVIPDGPFTCFDGAVIAGTKSGEIFVFDLNRSCLFHALKNILQGYENMIRGEENLAAITFLPLNAVNQIESQRELVLENDDHIAILLNESSLIEGQYILRNPDGTVRMKAKRDHVRVTVIKYIPQLATLAVGFNFGAFQLWNLMNLDLEFTSQVNVECLPVTHFGFQEPCDDPRAFCYLWAVFSVMDRFDEEEFPLAVMYSLTYQGKRMLSDTKCLYQEFLTATIRFQLELTAIEDDSQMVGGRCVSCHTYSVNSMLGGEGEESMLNMCQLVWECWSDNANSSAQYGMLLFDLDQWYKDQMPATYPLQSNAFMSATRCTELARGATATLDVRLVPSSVSVYCAATRLEEHFYPNSLRYDCICLNTSEACILSTTGIQRQIINSLDEVGPTALLNPTRLYQACVQTGLVPLYLDPGSTTDLDDQRRYLLSVALEARLSRLLNRCAHDWATGSHVGAGCTLTFLIDWCWQRAIELKENARELTAPLFTSSALPDRNVTRCLEYCVQQLTQLTGLLDAILTKCCNLVVPDALSEMEEKYKGIGTVSLYFQVVQWFLRVGLLPERQDACDALPYPGHNLVSTYNKRRIKLHRLQEHNTCDENGAKQSCALLYIDQLIEQEFGGDRIHEMWRRGGSECNGLYPPPSLYSLLRLYLLPDIAEEHKHSLVLYLLVDYSMVYDEVRYEAVIRRLMQFPTMFGLSNTAIKATQAFWHLDHRDFDFALDQLQCLTGNTLSEWQHQVVLSSLLAQKKTQAALQYLHVRKPAPIQTVNGSADLNSSTGRDHDKLEDWQSCCNLYLARGLVFEALDVVRMCVSHASTKEDKVMVLNFFFKGCKNTGQLCKVLQVTLLPFEEEIFINYLKNCHESQTSDILIMYYLQQARYLEAEQYNKRLKHSKSRAKDFTTSLESLADVMDREGARDTLVEVVCSTLPDITNTVACTIEEKDWEPHVVAPKPMSVYIQAQSSKNMFTYKSSFIQDTIENASETWMNKPKARRGLKRALNIEETPFICTPKLNRSKSIFSMDQDGESTPPKRARLDFTGTPKTPKSAVKMNETMSQQLSVLLDMPDVHSPDIKSYDRGGAETPHSILKIRNEAVREAVSPADSRYLGDSDDELLETASNHTHYSDSTNKHLRFTIPTASESGSTPSPTNNTTSVIRKTETELSAMREREREANISLDSYVTTESHAMSEPHPLESPPKKKATEETVHSRKSYKDSVRGRRSLSLSANSSLADDPNSSIESIADIPVTLINPRYSGERRRSFHKDFESAESATEEKSVETEKESSSLGVPKTPKCRRSIRAVSGESTPLISRSRSQTPERVDSPIATTPLRSLRPTRSRSRTPDVSPRSSPLDSIPEQPRQEYESEPHPEKIMLSLPRLRSRSRTPERIEKVVESPRLEAITESPSKSDSPTSSPTKRNLRSRSRTPELESQKEDEQRPVSPRTLRNRAKTPEKLLSPKIEAPKSVKKPLSRIVLEANAYAAAKQTESKEEKSSGMECTPMKDLKSVPSLMDVTFSPIVGKSVLHSSNDSMLSESVIKEPKSTEKSLMGVKSLPGFTLSESKFGKSVLHSYESSISEITHENSKSKTKIDVSVSKIEMKSLPAFTLSESYFEKSVLQSYQSSMETSNIQEEKETEKKIDLKFSPGTTSFNVTDLNKSVLGSHSTSLAESQDKMKDTSEKNMSSLMTSDSEIEDWKDKKEEVIQKEKEKIVEIEREINEIENEMSEEEDQDGSSENGAEMEDSSEDGEDSGEESSGVDVGDEEESEESDEENDTSVEKDNSEESSIDEVISIADTDESDETILQIDEDTKQSQNREVETVETEDKTGKEDSNDAKEITETTDPLNQAQISLLTDDTSMYSERSEVNLNYSDEVEKKQETPMETEIEKAKEISQEDKKLTQVPESSKKTVEPMEISELQEKATEADSVKKNISKDLTEKSMDVIEHSLKEQNIPDTVDAAVATDKIHLAEKATQGTQEVVSYEVSQVMKDAPKIDIKDRSPEKRSKIEDPSKKSKPASRTEKRTRSTAANTSVINVKDKALTTKQDAKVNTDKISVEEKATQDSEQVGTINVEASQEEPGTAKISSLEKETISEDPSSKAIEKSALRKKRTKSTSSNKSVTETEIEPKTPVTRKRSQSIASNKSATETQKTPENVATTPSRTRNKTPTSVEVRKILTRRASKELSGKVDDSSVIEELTPRRRSTRSRSTNVDDNVSVASESSVKTTRSKASEDGGEMKSRRSKKSLLPVKPDLSVIPESAVEDVSKTDTKESIISEYSSSRRLTRHQKSVLESWLEPQPSSSRAGRRRVSTASKTSVVSNTSTQLDDEDTSPTHSSAFDVQSIDRITLLNKADFDGSPDSSEAQSTISPDSVASDASKQRRARTSRAVSESKSTPKARAIRRVSIDLAGTPEASSPVMGRRASFNRAIEALHTPTKGRRASTDLRKGETDSVQSSPPSESETPPKSARRPRRTSTQSNTSQAKDTSLVRRTRKLSAVEETKDTKK